MTRTTTEHASSQPHRRRWPTLVGVLLLLLAASVVRSPAQVITRFTAERAGGSDTTSVLSPSGGTERSVPDVAREADEVVRAADERGGPRHAAQDGLLLREVRGGWRLEPGVEEAAALALLVGHGWSPSGGGGMGVVTQDRIVVLEAVEQPGAAAAVVTLLITSASRLDGAWSAGARTEGGDGRRTAGAAPVVVHRVAVPVLIGPQGATLGGEPWELPAPLLHGPALTGAAIDDPVLLDAARRALDAVGIDGRSLVSLEASAAWPFIARTAQGPHPWLRWHLDHFVVSGLPLQQAAVIGTHGGPG